MSGDNPTGVEDHGQMDTGVPRKPGRPCCFLVQYPAERPEDQLLAHRFVVVTAGDTERTAATRGIAERREPKRGKMHNRESERSDSTVEVGELALSADPAEGSGTSHHTTDVGIYDGCSET